jgi:YhfZ C-terminal domain
LPSSSIKYTGRYEGLATGLRAELERLNVPFSLAFMSGAKSRLAAIASGEQFAVVSRRAALLAQAAAADIEVVANFGPGSYVSGHSSSGAGRLDPGTSGSVSTSSHLTRPSWRPLSSASP